MSQFGRPVPFMRFTLLALLAYCLAFAGCTAKPGPESFTLRVVSYNIHHGEGTDGVFDYERLAKVINDQQPDLVALQEVDRNTTRSSGVDQAARLGQLTSLQHVYGEAMPFAGGQYGEAILSRWPIVSKHALALPEIEGSEPRALVVVRVKPPDTSIEIVFAGTHLAHDSAIDRLDQAVRIRKALLGEDDVRKFILFAGDLNAEPDSPPIEALLEGTGFIDVFQDDPDPTYPSDTPRKRIDWLLVRTPPGWRVEVLETKVIADALASDHALIFAELRFSRE